MLAQILLGITAGPIALLVVCSKLTPLAGKGFLGWPVLAANLVYEVGRKGLGCSRAQLDVVFTAIVGALLCFGGAWYLLGWVLLAGGLELWNRSIETEWLTRPQARPHGRQRYPIEVPMPIPNLIVQIDGPFTQRRGLYDLGDLPVGCLVRLLVRVANCSRVPPQWPLKVEISEPFGNAARVCARFESLLRAPNPGEVWEGGIDVRALQDSGPLTIRVSIKHADETATVPIRVRSIFDPSRNRVVSAEITRWKGARRSAFAWRGDMDLYDPSTFQSIEGLQAALELSKRYRIPSTLYLSGRLSLVPQEHRAFCEKLGVDRHSDQIEQFVAFLRQKVDLKPLLDYPLPVGDKPYAMEIGNHYYLHYGTHTAMHPANDWTMGAKLGAGHYPWQSEVGGTLIEQRDNAQHNAHIIEQALGVRPLSWGIPDRTRDEHTPAALEAAGIEVASDCDAGVVENVLKLPPPHHPRGTERLVELTKKYPGDPSNIYQVAMLKQWMAYALKTGRPFVFMAHHHLRQYEGWRCWRMCEEIFRHVLEDFHGDFYISTIYGVGVYWRDVLSERSRTVSINLEADRVVGVTNTGDRSLQEIPLDLRWADGRRTTILLDLQPGQTRRLMFEDGE